MIYDGRDFGAIVEWVARTARGARLVEPGRKVVQVHKWDGLTPESLGRGPDETVAPAGPVESKFFELDWYRGGHLELRKAVTLWRWMVRRRLRKAGGGVLFGGLEIRPSGWERDNGWVIGGFMCFCDAENLR